MKTRGVKTVFGTLIAMLLLAGTNAGTAWGASHNSEWSWSPAARISSSDEYSSGVSANLSDDGTGNVIWYGFTSLQAHPSTTVSRNGRWSKPTELSQYETNGSLSILGTPGGAIATWSAPHNNVQVIQAARRVGSHWGAATTISAEDEPANWPASSSNTVGDVDVIWQESRMTLGMETDQIKTVRLSHATEQWQAHPASLGSTCDYTSSPTVSTMSDGSAWASWVCTSGAQRTLQVFHLEGGVWNQAFTEPATDSTSNSLSSNTLGEVIVTWIDNPGSGDTLMSRTFMNGHWEQPQAIASPGLTAIGASVILTNSHHAFAVWRGAQGVWGTERSSEGTWTAARQLSPSGDEDLMPSVTAEGDVAIVGWSLRPTGTSEYIAQVREFDGVRWELTHTLTPDGEGGDTPSLSMNASGETLAVWSTSGVNYASFFKKNNVLPNTGSNLKFGVDLFALFCLVGMIFLAIATQCRRQIRE